MSKLIDTVLIATRLKALRESRGLNHKQLSDSINKETGHYISPDSLKAYEQLNPDKSRYEKNLGMSAQNFYYLAQYYGVSADYILGLSDIKSPTTDIQAICHSTGLSEDVAQFLYDVRRVTYEDKLAECERTEILTRLSRKMNMNHDTRLEVEAISDLAVDFLDKILSIYCQEVALQENYNAALHLQEALENNEISRVARTLFDDAYLYSSVCRDIGQIIQQHLEFTGPYSLRYRRRFSYK